MTIQIEDLNSMVVKRVINIGDRIETRTFLDWLETTDENLDDRFAIEANKFELDVYNDIEFDMNDGGKYCSPEVVFTFETSDSYEFEQVDEVINDIIQNVWRNYCKHVIKAA